MQARSAAFCSALGVELPINPATLHPEWAPLIELHAKSVRVMLPERFIPVVEAFLVYKKRVGNEVSKRFFAQFKTIADYVPRLIEKRPAAFFGRQWTMRLRNGTTVKDAHDIYKDGGSPDSLAEYMTLEEAQIAALLVVSSMAIWRMDGMKIVQAVAVGITPPKLDEPDLFDALHIIAQRSGSAAGRGMGAAHVEVDKDGSVDGYFLENKRVDEVSHWQHVWAQAYVSAMKHEPSAPTRLYFTADPVNDPTWFEPLSDGKTYLNKGVFERRIRFALETFFLDCVNCSEALKQSICAILESRLFVAPDDPDRQTKEKYIINAIITALDTNVFKNISTLQLINFTASACIHWYARATLDGGIAMILAQHIEFISSDDKERTLWNSFFEAAVVDKARFEAEYFTVVPIDDPNKSVWNVPADLFPCVAYAWDVNALPGNMVWAGLAASIPNSNVAEVHNPYINVEPELRTLLTPFGPTHSEATLAKLYLTQERYYKEMGNIKAKVAVVEGGLNSHPSADPDFIVHTEGFGERDMSRAWGSMAFHKQGSQEEWTALQTLYETYSQKHFIMASSMSTTASGIPEYTQLLDRQLSEMLPLKPGWGLKVVTTKVSATDAISSCLPEVARIATMKRVDALKVSPKMAAVGNLFGGFMGPLTGASSFESVKVNAIGDRRALRHFSMSKHGNFFVNSLEDALKPEVSKNLKDALKEVLDELNADKDIGLLVVEPIAAHAAPAIVFWRKPLLEELVKHCVRNNILVLADETLTGFCATGALFSFMHYGITPDFILVGKRLGLAALIAVHGRHDWLTDITCMGYNGTLGLTTSTGDLFSILRSIAFLKRLMPVEDMNKRITALGKAALPIFVERISATATGVGIFITLPKTHTKYLGVTRCLNRRFILPFDLDPKRLPELINPSQPPQHFNFCAICTKSTPELKPCELCPSSFHQACHDRDAGTKPNRCHECSS